MRKILQYIFPQMRHHHTDDDLRAEVEMQVEDIKERGTRVAKALENEQRRNHFAERLAELIRGT